MFILQEESLNQKTIFSMTYGYCPFRMLFGMITPMNFQESLGMKFIFLTWSHLKAILHSSLTIIHIFSYSEAIISRESHRMTLILSIFTQTLLKKSPLKALYHLPELIILQLISSPIFTVSSEESEPMNSISLIIIMNPQILYLMIFIFLILRIAFGASLKQEVLYQVLDMIVLWLLIQNLIKIKLLSWEA